MRKKITKKSQGNILIAVLAILMVLAVIVVVWNFIYPIVTQKSAEADTSFFNVNLNIKEVVLSETGAAKVSIQRGSGEGEISSLKFIFYDEGGQSYTSLQNTNLPKEFETKTYFFSPFSNLKKLKSVSVAPVMNNKLGKESKFSSQPVLNFPRGLVSWWRFDDNRDLVGKNNGINSVQINSSNLILDGINYMDVGSDNSLNLDKEFSVSSWIKANSYDGKIISKGANYEVNVNSYGKIIFIYGNKDYIESFNPIELNQWQHVVVSINWGGVWKIFINGNLESVGGPGINTPILNSDKVYIGEGFNGNIDDIMLFDKILTQDNIKFLYNNQLD
ncbi:LamG domain-containing protein [Candidatus Pacearchaeota archaeon]|nr:hypothetical protein [uncultured archaeon]AQS32529.1 hypothetical protein [uncultured archaeon]MBS3075588.1 LamG domain-containing protein [Candidatus Pacearchaeota archaeon]